MFKYILDRLALFSDIDLENLDVALGRTTNLSINNVSLDPDKIGVPGMHLRNGIIDKLQADLSMSHVELNCTGVNLTVALDLAGFEDNELSTILSKTTDDLANSLSLNNDGTNDMDTVYDQTPGYGPGEFNFMSTITDMALSQLNVVMVDVVIKVILDETTNIRVSIGEISFKTVESKHCIRISDIKAVVEASSSGPSNSFSQPANTSFTNLGLSTHGEPDQSLLQSTVIGQSMYLSAMEEASASIAHNPHDQEQILLVLDAIDIVHQSESPLNISAGILSLNILAAAPLLDVFFMNRPPGSKFASNSTEGPDLDIQVELKSCALCLGEAMDNSQSLLLICDDIVCTSSEARIDQIQIIHGEDKVLVFDKDHDQEDLIATVSNDQLGIQLANICRLNLSFRSLLAMRPLLTILDHLPANNGSSSDGNSRRLRLDTNHIYASLFDEIRISVDPIHCTQKIQTRSVKLEFGDNSNVHFKDVEFDTSATLKTIHKGKRRNAFGPKLQINKAESYIILGQLIGLYAKIEDIMASSNMQGSETTASSVLFGLEINSLVCSGNFGPWGVFSTDLGSLCTVLAPDSRYLWIKKVHVSREFPDLGQVALIYNASHMLTTTPSISVELDTTVISLSNLTFDFHPRLLEIMQRNENLSSEPENNSPSFSQFSIRLKNCTLSLNPIGMPSNAVVVINEGKLVSQTQQLQSTIDSMDLLLIDDTQSLDLTAVTASAGLSSRVTFEPETLVSMYERQGYVYIGAVSMISLRVPTSLSIRVHASSIKLSSCADSTQILIQLINGLKPLDSDLVSHTKFKVEHSEELSGILEQLDDFFFQESKEFPEDDLVDDDVPSNLEFVESYFGRPSKADFLLDQDLERLADQESGKLSVFDHKVHQYESDLEFTDNHFGHDDTPQQASSPTMTVMLQVDSFEWDLFDGYDWSYTRDVITASVRKVETVARSLHGDWEKVDNTAEPVVADYLFDSIYIGVPAGSDPQELEQAINRTLGPGDKSKEKKTKSLNLNRSSDHRVQICLRQVTTNLDVFAEGVVRAKIAVNVKDAEILDNMPTSTWNKFLTYQRRAGERESGSDLMQLKLDIVQPVPYSTATEGSLRVDVLPLRLHIDQDTSDFITRFFTFKDERFITEVTEDLFLQKADIRAIYVDFDYKPKKVDYAGLKAGRTIEFMNFFPLERTDIKLKHVVLYGVNGFVPLSRQLNALWIPDIVYNQRKQIMSGISPLRSFARLGGGFKDLIWIPVEQYRADGRIVAGIQKGIWKFASNTANELAKFGAKVAAGTQTFLESVELAMAGESPYYADDEDDGAGDPGVRPVVSHYAHPPSDVTEALASARDTMSRNFARAREAVRNIGAETAERGSAQGAAVAVAHQGPVAVLRPMIGASEAVSRTFMGMTYQMNPSQMEDIREKYKD